MKPQEMDQEKILTWIKAYLERSEVSLLATRDQFYDAVVAGDDAKAELLLKDMSVMQRVHGWLLEEVIEAKEYQKMLEVIFPEGVAEA